MINFYLPRLRLGILGLFSFICLSACIPSYESASPQVVGGFSALNPPPLAESYLLGAGDRLKITVFGENELTGEYAVNPSGVIDFPLIGEVRALGVSLRQLERDMTRRLKAGYLKDPRISIEVLNFRPFFITGEVRNAGQFPYKASLTVQEAVAIAGGYTYRANTRVVLLRRFGDEKELSIELQSQRVSVYPGDQLRVGERFF
jgi:protein involved in polysaccharide export with SLBB domain